MLVAVAALACAFLAAPLLPRAAADLAALTEMTAVDAAIAHAQRLLTSDSEPEFP
jgi:hypothetical protein